MYKLLTKNTNIGMFDNPHMNMNTSMNMKMNMNGSVNGSVNVNGICSSEYLIAGIKYKYEQLREEHQKVLAELQGIKKIDAIKRLEEISIYCKVLEENNIKLGQGLRVFKAKLQAY